MSTFDPSTFEETVVEQASETKMTPIPEGEYTAYVGDEFSWRTVNNTQLCAVPLLIADMPEDVVEALSLGDRQPTINYDMFLDTNDAGQLEFGANKNVALGRLREALGQNRSGEPWSFKMLKGAGPVRIKIEPDKKNPEMYSRVTKITAAA